VDRPENKFDESEVGKGVAPFVGRVLDLKPKIDPPSASSPKENTSASLCDVRLGGDATAAGAERGVGGSSLIYAGAVEVPVPRRQDICDIVEIQPEMRPAVSCSVEMCREAVSSIASS
jgi:hypothetical protein